MQRDATEHGRIVVARHLKRGDEVDPFMGSGVDPGLIEPSERSTAGWLCSRMAASVPTGGLSQATTAMRPLTSVPFK